KQKITLQAGQSSITLEGANITFACPGNFTVKGGQHAFDAGAREAAALQKLPDSRVKLFDEQFVVLDPNGKPMPAMPYSVDGSDGKHRATTEAQGTTDRISTDASEKLKFSVEWYTVHGKQ
ncbi:uncharacterized protein (DUF2345 family), partial [Undibacterium sp. GrIS 1.8]|uniref:DUF2345 domain-containing protein n=1 Tax=unclassified Undibacterium TaxID=2630295 RepID=UPI003395FA1F